MENKQKIKWILCIIFLILATNTVTFFLTATGIVTFGNRIVVTANDESTKTGIRKLAALKRAIDEDYYQEVDGNALMDGAISGMFNALGDPYSAYYSSSDFQQLMSTSIGNYAGIGLMITEDENKHTIVVGTYPNTPAAEAGFLNGDKITAINGEDMQDAGADAVAGKMKGEEGSTLDITFEREGVSQTVTLTREKINIPTVSGKMLDNGIAYIHISDFTESTADDFNSTLSSLMGQSMTGLIVDLRNNGGGMVPSAQSIADRLLGEGLICYTMDKYGNREDITSSDEEKLEMPIAVLVNNETASASEILAGALQDNDAAVLIGTQTYGKGIIQEVVSLSDGSVYKLTYEEYFTPDGHTVQGEGLTPDIEVESDEENIDFANTPQTDDEQLQKAIETLLNQ